MLISKAMLEGIHLSLAAENNQERKRRAGLVTGFVGPGMKRKAGAPCKQNKDFKMNVVEHSIK